MALRNKSEDIYTSLLLLKDFFGFIARHTHPQGSSAPHPDRLIVAAPANIQSLKDSFPLSRPLMPLDEETHAKVFRQTENTISPETFMAFMERNRIEGLARLPSKSSAEGYLTHKWLGRKENGEPVILHIPGDRGQPSARLPIPLVVQPLATLDMDPDRPDAGKIEILPYLPTFPKLAPALRQGSRTPCNEFSIVGSDGFRIDFSMPGLEQALADLAIAVDLAGFQINVAKGPSVSPEGWLVFADADAVQKGRLPVGQALCNLTHFMDRSCLKMWESHPPSEGGNRLYPYTSEDDEMSPF